ncbi:MAG: VWA domain-containing protein [Enterococcus lacertideformus]|uniref:VWA domain-containing protein n=1 Tax=Enterococcus lacertideformus TaxID=2771493 RepID=A0A931B2W6_9ENTE|nr:VWA domain-containing protein [Enterococcus lacertideformus]
MKDNHLSGSASEIIRNYDYGNLIQKPEAQDEVQMFSITGDPMNFASGYHEYGSGERGRVNTKKTVSPTEKDNIFQIQLDTIGDAIRPIPKLDIVLVLDKSSSMNDDTVPESTRWRDLKEAVEVFADKMLMDYQDVQIGMAAFGSYQSGLLESNRPYGEIASFSNLGSGTSMPENMTGFTTDKSRLMSHSIINTADAPTSSGTPTFLGVDAGLKLLTTSEYGARPDAEKVLITITDGVPTFRHRSGYMTSNTPLDTSLGYLTKSRVNNGQVLRMTATNSLTIYDGNGTTDYSQDTLDFINMRYGQFTSSNINRYAVGFHTGDTANAVVSALGQDGTFRASSVQDLISALDSALSPLISTISNGLITDPLSEFVNLIPNSIHYSALSLDGENLTEIKPSDPNYPNYAQAISNDSNNEKLIFGNVSLGSVNNVRQGFRVIYQVEIDENYHDGAFYPTNKTTYLTNDNGTNFYYAVPSVKKIFHRLLQKTLR